MRSSCAVVLAPWLLAPAAAAEIIPVDPFTGDFSEPLNYPGTTIVSSFDIFADEARLHSFDDETTTIHYLFGSTFAGDPVTPRTGSKILGFTQGPGIFALATPARRFGAYWNNNSGTDDARVEFFDVDGDLIGTETAAVPVAGDVWTWNGWESDVPIGSIRVTGFGVIDGFIWFDDLEMSVVPAPAASLIVILPLLGTSRRHREVWPRSLGVPPSNVGAQRRWR